MKAQFSYHELAQLSHREFIQLFVADSRSPLLAREFMARYDSVIRQAVAKAWQRFTTSKRLLFMLDESVSEIYSLLLRRNCRALRRFCSEHENAIFVYLRIISLNLVRNQIRDEARRHGFIQRPFFPEPIEYADASQTEEAAGFIVAAGSKPGTVEWSPLEDLIRVKFRQLFSAAKAHRNFIIFKLRFLHGYQYQEIARIKALELSSHGVANTAFSIRKQLRREFAKGRTA
jgi:DNA-directed RNA polymerase specialized sigma24 family protein